MACDVRSSLQVAGLVAGKRGVMAQKDMLSSRERRLRRARGSRSARPAAARTAADTCLSTPTLAEQSNRTTVHTPIRSRSKKLRSLLANRVSNAGLIVRLLLLRSQSQDISEIDGEWKDNRGAFLAGDVEERAEKAELHGLRAFREGFARL